MTLSSTSRQQRKSLLPKPRPSSSRRHPGVLASSESTASRIARRVPSPLLASSYNNGLVAQAVRLVPQQHTTAADGSLLIVPEFGPRRALAAPPQSRIPWSGHAPEQSDASSLLSSTGTPSPPDAKKRVDVSIQYLAPPPASTDIRHERLFTRQEGLGRTTTTTIHEQRRDTEGNHGPAARQRDPSRRRPASASTALTLTLTNGFSRAVDNSSPGRDKGGDGGMSALTWKKPAAFPSSSSVGGKENRRPRRVLARVPPPPVIPVLTIPPRSIRRSVVDQPSSSRTGTGTSSSSSALRETSRPLRPLVIRKQLPSHLLSSQDGSASGDSGVFPVVGLVPVGIEALIGDIDRFAKEWTEMFDELSAAVGAEDHRPEDGASKFRASVRVRPTGQPEGAGPLQINDRAAGKGTPTRKRLLPVSSGSAASVNTLQASANGETVHLDVTPASLARWQHRDKAMARDAPEEDKQVRKHNILSDNVANIRLSC